MRSVPVEWDLFGQGPWDYATNQQNVYNFWKVGAERAAPYEGVFTIGMRGNGVCFVVRSSARSVNADVPHLVACR